MADEACSDLPEGRAGRAGRAGHAAGYPPAGVGPRTWALLNPLLTLLAALLTTTLVSRAVGGRWSYAPLHSTMEAVSGMLAVLIAGLLIWGRELHERPHLDWVVASLLVQGVLDLVHAGLPCGPTFHWSRTLPTVLGGVLFALVWVPIEPRRRRALYAGSLGLAALLGAALIAVPDAWPPAFSASGQYTTWAKVLNGCSGLAYLVAVLFFLREQQRKASFADGVFASHALLLAVASGAFGLSSLWDGTWWAFHAVRLMAYVVSLGYIADLLRRVVRRRSEAAVEAERATALRFADQFIGMLGHDLRNPLNAIQMAATLLRETAQGRDAQVIDRQLSSARRMSSMVGQLLDLTRARLGGGIEIARQRTSLAELVSAVVDGLLAIHPGREIHRRLAPDVVGNWDPDRLAQVVSNLVGNALEHGHPARPVEIRLTGEGEHARLVVHSHGPVIPPELLAVIFDPYRRSDARSRHSQGLGLGLYVTQQIILAHGGSIDVRSTEAEGTTFEVTLPRLAGPAGALLPSSYERA